jgi:hypothetical protein
MPKSSNNKRLIVDTTKVNRFMTSIHFKMDEVPTLVELFQKNDYAISFDLNEAYNHVPVHPSMQHLLGVCWRGQCYKFVGMSFGLNDVPRVFSRIMRYVVAVIRKFWNIKTAVCLDDIILLHQDKDHLLQAGKEITLLLQWLGWNVNKEKRHLIPSRTWKYLGWEWN